MIASHCVGSEKKASPVQTDNFSSRVPRRQAATTPVMSAEHDREERAQEQHRQRVGERLPELREHGLAVLERAPDVTLREVLR